MDDIIGGADLCPPIGNSVEGSGGGGMGGFGPVIGRDLNHRNVRYASHSIPATTTTTTATSAGAAMMFLGAGEGPTTASGYGRNARNNNAAAFGLLNQQNSGGGGGSSSSEGSVAFNKHLMRMSAEAALAIDHHQHHVSLASCTKEKKGKNGLRIGC